MRFFWGRGYANDSQPPSKRFKIIRQLLAIDEALRGFSDESIFAEIQRRRSGVPTSEKLIKEVEIETLLSQTAEIGNHTPESDFYACNRPLTELLPTLKERIDRIVLVHRLREVVAQAESLLTAAK